MNTDLKTEQARIIRQQRSLAATISSYYPRTSGSPIPLGEKDALARVRSNENRLREIKAELDARIH